MPVTIPMRGIFGTCSASTVEHVARSKEHRARKIAAAKIAHFEFRIANFKQIEHKFGGNRNKILLLAIIGSSRSIFVSSVSPAHLAIRNPHYLITLSALASMCGEMVAPICFAVFKLITISNFVGCSTGMSAGLAPFKILTR
jgi:hypothetical protein